MINRGFHETNTTTKRKKTNNKVSARYKNLDTKYSSNKSGDIKNIIIFISSCV